MRHCQICENPARVAIEAAIVSGKTQAAVAREYAVHRSALARHSENHANPNLVALTAAQSEPGEGDDGAERDDRPTLEQLETKLVEVEALQKRAAHAGHLIAALAAAKQWVGLVVEIGHLKGHYDPAPPLVVDLVQTDEWVQLRSAIMKALEPYPEARQAVADAL